MRQRSISAVGVVIVGILPALIGGPIFAGVLTAICLVALYEFLGLARHVGRDVPTAGLVVLPLYAVAVLAGGRDQALLGVTALAVAVPLLTVMFRDDQAGSFVDWSLAAAGTLLLGIPLYAALETRRITGTIDAGWLSDLAGWLSLGWDGRERGLAWLLLVISVTWLGDTGAYLVGRSFGKRPLIPRLSPKKTVEGLAGGLGASALTGALAVALFGLGVPWWAGLAVGLALGIIGVLGDLAESLLKRQAGVKDSGTLIPGHGGMFDRIDALLFTWTAGWFLASLVDRTL